MSCCGKSRAAARTPSVSASVPFAPAVAAPVQATVQFVYTGQTRLSAEGPVTHRRYRFEAPGAVVEVDARDAPSFAAIPGLKRAS